MENASLAGSENDKFVEYNDELMENDENPWTLENIPTEIFLHICSFLDGGSLLHRLSLVCKKFHEILSNETTWKIRQMKLWGVNGTYPPITINEDEFPWSRACVKREEQIRLWGNEGANLANVELHGHIACVDSIHLFNGGNLLATGSRDRSLVIWDVAKASEAGLSQSEGGKVPVAGQDSKLITKSGAHNGWIWALASNSRHLLSASWDTTVKIWDRGSEFQFVTEFKTRVACLSLSAMDDIVSCGTFDAKVLLFDPRKGYEGITWYRQHTKSVLALGMDDKRIISCGEDGKVVCYDRRTNKVLKSFTVPITNSYATCLSFRREDPAPLFYIGDRFGNLHLVDVLNFSIARSYMSVHTQMVRGIFHGLGSVITCSKDGQFKVLEPSSELNEIACYSIKEELPSVHSLYNIVAVAGGDGIVRLWSPRDGF